MSVLHAELLPAVLRLAPAAHTILQHRQSCENGAASLARVDLKDGGVGGPSRERKKERERRGTGKARAPQGG